MNSLIRPFASCCIAAILVVAAAVSVSGAADTDLLVITTETGRHVFHVEQAVTEQEREIGLMNRETLARDSGMIFRFPQTQPVSMWMKNTLVPLDMVFVREDGTVAGVHEHAVPLSETIIPSPGPVRFVVELAGGVADEIHLEKGDRVEHPLIGD